MTMDIHDILKRIPHRYPILLVDRVLELKKNDFIRALKNVSINEPYFSGHFPQRPVMPGVLMIEAMAQTGGCLLMQEYEDRAKKVIYFMGIDAVKFRKPVLPGDQHLEPFNLGTKVRGRRTDGGAAFRSGSARCADRARRRRAPGVDVPATV